MKKKLFALALCVIMVVAMAAPALALEPALKVFTKAPSASGISPRYIPCPQGGFHTMEGRGQAWVYEGSYQNPGALILHGCCSQCTKCRLALATENNPFSAFETQKIGKYAMWTATGNLSSLGTNFYGGLDGEYYGSLKDDPFWAGFQFA